jgi:hypothetical protein
MHQVRPQRPLQRLQAGTRRPVSHILLIDGQPEKTVKVGESYQVPSGTIHDARSGPQGAKVIATYVVEKGKPLASPAP